MFWLQMMGPAWKKPGILPELGESDVEVIEKIEK
jgi:hypothetical protein